MPQILEASMLICFGVSWPINVYKNIKAKSAKSMSIQFILLIIFGYVAGITAKLITHSVNYVLAVYIINLVIVSVNVFVYIKNKRYDKMNTNERSETDKAENVRVKKILNNSNILSQIERYKAMNMSSTSNEIVFFGTDSFSKVNLNEMAQNYSLNETILNRSLSGLYIEYAADAIKSMLTALTPIKVFLNFGEVDIQSKDFNIESFIESYHWILYTIHSLTDAKLYIVSVCSALPLADDLNDRLKKLSEETGCVFIDLHYQENINNLDNRVFSGLRTYIRSHQINFTEAIRQ